MYIERIVYPKLGIIDEIEVKDDEDIEEISEENKTNDTDGNKNDK